MQVSYFFDSFGLTGAAYFFVCIYFHFASHATKRIGTVLFYMKKKVLRIRDVYPGSRIPDPDFDPFRIPDLGPRIQKQQQKRGVKKYVKPFFAATNFTKLKIILFFKC